MRTTTNYGLIVWNLGSDEFNHADLEYNWDTIDAALDAIGTPAHIDQGTSLPTGLTGADAGHLFYLTAAASGFAADTVVRYDGSSWRTVGPVEIFSSFPTSGNFSGRIVALSTDKTSIYMRDQTGNKWNQITTGPRSMSVASANALSASAGQVVVVTNGGTLTRGSLTVVAYDMVVDTGGGGWIKVGPYTPPSSYPSQRLVGELVPWAGTISNANLQATSAVEPVAGYLLANGASLLRTGTYAGLFAILGTTYGSVDGTHFTLPDFRGKSIFGQTSTTDANAAYFGSRAPVAPAPTRTLAKTNLPSHAHSGQTELAGSGDLSVGVSGGGTTYTGIAAGSVTGGTRTGTIGLNHRHVIDSEGDGNSFSIMPPYDMAHVLIRYAS
jgi:microcystin-dependent protein